MTMKLLYLVVKCKNIIRQCLCEEILLGFLNLNHNFCNFKSQIAVFAKLSYGGISLKQGWD